MIGEHPQPSWPDGLILLANTTTVMVVLFVALGIAQLGKGISNF